MSTVHRWGHHEDPDENRCRCTQLGDHTLIDHDCPVHGDPEPPEPDHRQLDLELDPKWVGNFPEGF